MLRDCSSVIIQLSINQNKQGTWGMGRHNIPGYLLVQQFSPGKWEDQYMGRVHGELTEETIYVIIS